MFSCQVFLIAIVAEQVLRDADFRKPSDSVTKVFARFVCSIVLHMLLSNEL